MSDESRHRNIPRGVRDTLKRDEVLLWELSGNIVAPLRQRLHDRLDVLLDSSDASLARIDESDPEIRIAALGLLAHYWPPNMLLEGRYLNILANDSEMDARALAVSCFSGLYRGSHDHRTLSLLSKIVREPANSRNLRAIAYLGVLKVLTVGINDEQKFALLQNKTSLPNSIDLSVLRA